MEPNLGIAKMPFDELPKCEPSERYCDLLSGLPESGRSEALKICATGVGRPDPLIEGPEALGSFFRGPTLDEIRKKLRHLVQRERVFEGMLLPGLHHFVVNGLRTLGKGTAISNAIDSDLDWLRKFEAWKRMPAADRPSTFTDEMIEKAIPTIKARMAERSKEGKVAAQTADLLERAWEEKFTPEYWQDWLKRTAEELDKED